MVLIQNHDDQSSKSHLTFRNISIWIGKKLFYFYVIGGWGISNKFSAVGDDNLLGRFARFGSEFLEEKTKEDILFFGLSLSTAILGSNRHCKAVRSFEWLALWQAATGRHSFYQYQGVAL